MKRLATCSALILLTACGGNPSDPSPIQAGDFPSVPTKGNPGCTSTAPTTYMIAGLYDHVIDPTAPRLVASMTVGERVQLGVTGYGCGSYADTSWISTNPGVGAITPGTGFAAIVGYLMAASPGETQVFADFKADDGKRYRTTLAYCPGDLPGAGCANPRKIDVVRVVPR